MKLAPLDDRVVIKQSEAEAKSAGGIILPDAAKEKPQRGKIILKHGLLRTSWCAEDCNSR